MPKVEIENRAKYTNRLLEVILSRENMLAAMKRVNGTYNPSPVRRVRILKINHDILINKLSKKSRIKEYYH